MEMLRSQFTELRYSEEIYRSLIENMNEAVLLSDDSGKILFLNTQFCVMTGYTYEELIGQNGYELLAPKKLKAELKNKVVKRKEGISDTYEMELVRKDGSGLLIRNSASPVNDKGKFIGVMSVMSDITNEKKQEKLLQAIHDSLDMETGDGYFSSLTEFLSQNLGVKVAMVAAYASDEDAAETISFKMNGKVVDNIKYKLENTPCANVLNKEICVFPERVQQLFPLDQDLVKMGVHSYVGVPLFDSKNRVSGLIVIMDDKPLKDIEEKKFVISLLATRAGNELERLRMQKTLEENELKYRNVVEDQTDYIFRWLPDGKIVFANKSFLKFHNATEEDLLGKNLFDLTPTNEVIRMKKKLATLSPSSPVGVDRHESIHPVHGYYWHEWTDRALFDKNGNVTIYQSVGRDITDKKLAEIKLAENESRFRMLVENSFDIYSICDSNGVIIYCSPNVKKILGYEPEEIVYSSAFALFHSKVTADAIKKFNGLFHSDIDHHVFLHKMLSKDGKYRVFQTTAKILLLTTGEKNIIFNSNDITEKHFAEKQLKESEKLKDAILSALSASISVINDKGVIVSVNKTWKEFSESNDGSVHATGIGANYLSVCEKAARAGDQFAKLAHQGLLDVLYNRQALFELEYPCDSKTQKRWFLMRVTPLDGIVDGAVVSHYDISEKKKQEGLLLLSNTEIQNIDRLNRAVISGDSLVEISTLLLRSLDKFIKNISSRIYLVNPLTNELELYGENSDLTWVNKIEKKTGIKLSSVIPSIKDKSYFGNIIKNKETVFTSDEEEIIKIVEAHTENPVLKTFSTWAIKLVGIKSFAILPISSGSEVFGLVTISSPEVISEFLQKSITRFTEQAGAALAKKNTENKLIERENYLSTLIASLPDLLFRIDKTGIILDYKSNGGERNVSKSDGSLIGLNYQRLIPKSVIELHNQSVTKALLTGEIVSYDFEIPMPSENSKFYEARIKSNALNEFVLIVRDTTNEKQQQRLIQDKEQKLNEAQKIAMVGSWHLDIQNNVLEWSDEACRIFGVEAGSKSTLEKFLSIVHPDDREYVSEKWTAALKNESYDIEHRIIVNGKIKWVREIASLEINSEGLVIAGLGTTQDITSKKIAETKLIRREKLLSFSHQLSKTGYYTWNQSKNSSFWSEELRKLLELTDRSIKPSFELFLQLIHPEDTDSVKDFFAATIKEPRPFTLDYRVVTFRGTEKYFRESGEFAPNEAGETIVVGVIQDITEIKDFEKALLQRELQIKRSNKLNTQIIETSDQFFYVSKIDHTELPGTRLTYASPQVQNIFGISSSEFISDNLLWRAAIHPADALATRKAAEEMYKTKKPLTLIYRIKNRQTGLYYWIEDYARPLLDADGEVVELYGSVKNINERKKAEEELLKREKLLREAQHIAKLGTWEWDLNSDRIFFNEEMFRILELNVEDFGGKLKELTRFLSPESIQRFQEAIGNASENYKAEDIELKIITAKGNERKLLIRGSEHKEVSGQNNIARGTALDITEIWKSHEALYATEEKFKKIFETVTDIYYQTDLDGMCTMISPSCEISIGYTQLEMIGKNLSSLYEFPEERKKLMNLILKDGLVNNYEISLITKQGQRIYVSANISLLYDANGKPSGLQGIVRDISEKKKNELEREKLLLELTNKYNQLMQFNYIVSHNLRSPITNLLGLSNLFDVEMNENDQKEVIRHIRNSVASMDELVKDLNMILATRSAINENKEQVQLTNILDAIKNNLRNQIDESSAMIISDIAEDNNNLYTIKSYLQSILYNLVNNAIKYRSDCRNPVIIISSQKTSENSIVKIVDNGNGIDLQKFEKQLFGLYKRFDLSKEGRGLGLHMTKTQVEALGGEIKVESELGKGTTFTIILPN